MFVALQTKIQLLIIKKKKIRIILEPCSFSVIRGFLEFLRAL